jgi:hypothetical protein
MPYDLGTTLLGSGVLNAAQINASFARRRNAAKFGPLPDLGSAILRQAELTGLNGDFLAAEIGDETGWWISDRALKANNPAGLGATDDGAWGEVFATPEEGIHAQCAHWLTYIYGKNNPIAADDPRYKFTVVKPEAGHISVINQIGNGVWATATDYATSVLNRMNDLLADYGLDTGGTTVGTANWIDGTSVPVPTEQEIGFPVIIDWSGDFGPERAITDIAWFEVHVGQGMEPGLTQVLTQTGTPIESATATIDRDGTLTFMVPLHRTPWCAANRGVDVRGIAVEQEGFAADPYTDEQYASMAAFFNWCVKAGAPIPPVYIGKDNLSDYGPLPDHPGILGHEDIPDPNNGHLYGGEDHHTDPGPNYSFPRLVQEIRGAVPVSDTRFFKVTGHSIAGNIKGSWERYGKSDDAIRASIMEFGYPVTDMVREKVTAQDGSLVETDVQYFERNVFEDHSFEGAGVLLRRLGAQAAKAAGYSGPGID